MRGVISLVGDHRVGRETLDQGLGLRDVMTLPRTEQQTHRIAQRIGRDMDLGAQPAPRSPQTLGIRPPLTIRAPAAC